jgi:hypothetical protein
MMLRLRTRWNLKDRERSLEAIASAVGVNIWRIAGEALLSLENEGFETNTHAQRLDVIGEFVAFLVHMVDRMVYQTLDQDQRRELVTAVAHHLCDTMQDNRVDASGQGQYREAFVSLLNARMSDYAECGYSKEEGPSFSLRRILGDYVRQQMGERDNKWIPDYVMDVEVPKAMKSLGRMLDSLIGFDQPSRGPSLPKGGVWGEG